MVACETGRVAADRAQVFVGLVDRLAHDVPDSSTHCISSGFSCSANGPSPAISSSGSTPDTRSKLAGSSSMYSSSTPTVSGGPSPKA